MSVPLALTLDPSGEVLSGDHIDIRISGAAPGSEVAVTGIRRFWDDKKELRSEAIFRADAEGVVDLSRDAPVTGSYAGVHPAGIFWSMTAAGAIDAETPVKDTVRIEAAAGSTSATAEVKLMWGRTDLVRRDAPFPGAFLSALPDARQRPAIICLLWGNEGADWYPGKLASRGYSVLALPYYSPPGVETPVLGLPTAFSQIPIDRLQAVHEWLRQQPEIDPDRMGLWGAAKGAEFALIAATKFPWIKGVVAVSPTDVVWEGWGVPAADYESTSCFSWQGVSLPYTPRVDAGSTFENHVRGRAAHPREAELARIPVEQYRQPLLLVGGEANVLWPVADMARAIAKRRAEAGLPTVTLIYPDAGTNIEDDGYSSAEWSMRGGGTLQGQGVARRDAFVKALSFLADTLGPVER